MVRTLSFLAILALGSATWAQPPKPLKLPDGVTVESLSDAKEAERVAKLMEEAYPEPRSEAAKMLIAILRGSQLNGTDGWFGPAQTRYTFSWLMKRSGVDSGSVAESQFPGPPDLFKALDRDGDGKITANDLDWGDRNSYVMQANMITRIFRRMEASGDGKLSKEEFENAFKRFSGGKDHFTADDFRRMLIPKGGAGFSAGDAPSIPVLVKGLFAGEIGSMGEGPKVGDKAPDFNLPLADGSGKVSLSSLTGQKPVVLCFGNFTCGPFRGMYPDVDSIFEKYKNQATFVMIYVREAHPSDGWNMESNTKMGVSTAQPKSFDERMQVCARFRELIKPGMRVLVDEINDPAGTAYSGMPARLYVIDHAGTVAYKSGRGPFGFKPGEMEQALQMSLLERTTSVVANPHGGQTLPTSAETWAKMPKVERGGGGELPVWARAVATAMPRTAAAMLELDLAQRTKSPLDPALRAKLRWSVAAANKCEYHQATALADLKRVAGADAVNVLTGPVTTWPQADRKPLAFVKQLTLDASKVTDEQFAELRKTHGDQGVAAMVLLAAYGNFQDRLILSLGLPNETPLPPIDVKFAAGGLQLAPLVPPSNPVPKLKKDGESVVKLESEWASIGYDDWQKRLDAQRTRTPRLPIPTWEETKDKLPAEYGSRPTKIVWSLVCNGYVPELAVPWGIATRTMWAELPQDRVFEESLFWIQTRSISCNYCMGHCEMLLEVAGLDKPGVAERTKRLAGTDWSAFPVAEQHAYAYAKKLSRTPWALTKDDYQTLVTHFGAERAMAINWWLCRGLYMTRISDGFQLPLERENVFDSRPKK